MKKRNKETDTEIWHGCYDQSWKDLIVPDAFSHPAKFSRNLIHQIYLHAKEMGWVKENDWVLDPFGGVALGAMDAMIMGLNWVGVELEQKFVDLGKQNIKKWERWPHRGTAQIIQGDSRQISAELLGYGAGLIVSSPPYADSLLKNNLTQEQFERKLGLIKASGSKWHRPRPTGNYAQDQYGHTPGQLGSMPEGSISTIVTSPPYEGSMTTEETKDYAGGSGVSKRYQRSYGKNKENLGNSSGDTFWSASKTIMEQCFQILKPGGHAIWVVKAYVKGGKIVDFPGRWQALCESVGFKTVCEHKAMLVKEWNDFFGTNKKEKKSFFRRLAESKGSPPIDFEMVICMVKKE